MKFRTAVLLASLAPILLIACDSSDDGDQAIAPINGSWYSSGDEYHYFIEVPDYKRYFVLYDFESGSSCSGLNVSGTLVQMDEDVWVATEGSPSFFLRGEALAVQFLDSSIRLYQPVEISEEEFLDQNPECSQP